MARVYPPPPRIRYVDVDLTDNVPLPPPDSEPIEGREHLLFTGKNGATILVPRAPLRHPSIWGVL